MFKWIILCRYTLISTALRRLCQLQFQRLDHRVQIFVAAPGNVDQQDRVLRHGRRTLNDLGNGMCRLQCRDNSFEATQHLETFKRFVICRHRVFGTAYLSQIAMFWSD